MSYTTVFGGELIFPSQLSYLAITTAVDVTLQWPTEQQITGDNVVADFIDMDATAAALNIDMPSALVTGTGNKATINNVGSNTFTVRDSTGGTIQSIAPGEQWIIVLRDNTTAAGLWRTFQLGASVAVASASALAGAGIKAIGVLLNQQIDSDVEAATPITVVDGDRAKCLIYTGGAGVADLPSAGSVGNDWFFMLRNSGSGTLAVTPPSGEIDGSSSINLSPNDSAFVFTDGIDYFTIGLSTGSTIAFDFVSLPIPGSGDFVLSGANLNRIAYRFTGALTGNRKVVVPDTTQQYWCDNQTTGAFILTIGTAGQATPPELNPSTTSIVYSDGTNVIDAVSQVSVMFPIMVSQGGTGATTAAGARANLAVPSELIDLIAGDGMVGGGDLSGPDRTFDVALTSDAQHGVRGGGTQHAAASLTVQGFIELATQTEVDAGSDALRAVTPATLAANDLFITSGSFTITWTGFTASITGTAFWIRTAFDGVAVVSVFLPMLTGTQNNTTHNLTGIPSEIQMLNPPAILQQFGITISEATVQQVGVVIPDADGTWGVFVGRDLTAWDGGTVAIIQPTTITYIQDA